MVNGIRDALQSLEARMNRRFEQIDRRFEVFDQRLEALDAKLDAKMSRHFVWIVGIQITSLIAMAGGFAAVASGFASVAAAIADR